MERSGDREFNETKEAKGVAEVKKVPDGRPKSMGFKKNAYTPIVEASMFLEQEKNGKAFHDFQPIIELADAFARDTYHDHTESQRRSKTEEEWKIVVGRMFSAVMAKKFAHSLTAKDNLENVRSAKVMTRAQFYFPTGFMNVINMYGKIREEAGGYDVSAQPFITTTYTMRAIHPDVNNFMGVENRIDRRADLFINVRSPTTFGHAKEWLVGYINSWARVAGTVTYNTGNDATTVVTTEVAPLVSGAVGYRVLNAALNMPPAIIGRLEQLAFLESIPNGAVWTLITVNRAFALGIQVVSFGTDEFDVGLVSYASDVQSIVMASLQTHYVMDVIRGCNETGTMGQVIRRERATLGHAPDKVSSVDIDVGWMMSGSMSYALMEPERYTVTSRVTPTEMLSRYLIKLRKQ